MNISISEKEEKVYAMEYLIYNVTEDLLVIMEENGISKDELAERVGKSTSYINKIFNGGKCLKLSTLSDICIVLDVKLELNIVRNQ